MTQIEEKQALCSRHRALLQVLMDYGTSGVMLLPQLRALCLAWGIFPSAQAVNRAVRDLRAAGILNRQTWVDNNSDLLLARKFVWRFFTGKEDIATPHRPATMAPYILQARKIDWLLTAIERQHLTSAEAAETWLRRHACTMFLRLPDLPDYYRRYARLLSEEHPENYREQLERLDADAARISALSHSQPTEAPPPPLATLAQAHRRGLYIAGISPSTRTVSLVLFAGRRTRATRVMDWVTDVQSWINSLLPYYSCQLVLYALDEAHRNALWAALTAPAPGRSLTPYWRERLVGKHLDGLVRLAVTNTDFVRCWCGGIQRTDCF